MLPMPTLHRAFPGAYATYASACVQTRRLFFLNDRTKFPHAMIHVSEIVSQTESVGRDRGHVIQLSLNDIQCGQASELMWNLISSLTSTYRGVLRRGGKRLARSCRV